MRPNLPRNLSRSAWAVALLFFGGCKPTPLSPLYCEGGVNAKGGGDGGECLSVSPDVAGDSDPKSVGTAYWEHNATLGGYLVRSDGKDHFKMFLAGKLAGDIVRDGHWITLTFTDKPSQTFKLRDDPPGFLN